MDQSIDARTHPGLGRGARGRERETHDGRRRGEASGYGNLKLQSGPRRVRDRAGRSSIRVASCVVVAVGGRGHEAPRGI